MWEEEWYWDEETGDEYPVGGKWVKMDEYDMEYNAGLDAFCRDWERAYTYSSPWGNSDVYYILNYSTGEFDSFYPYDGGYVLSLPSDGSSTIFARLVQPVF